MPPKPTKDQTKSTPTNKSANDKDTIKRLKILVDSLQKEKETWEKKLKEKDEEIERLKVVKVICEEGDNVSTTITNSRDFRPKDESKTMQQPGVKKEDTSLGSQLSVSVSDIRVAVQTDDSSKQTNNNSRETRSAPAANGTTGEGNIQNQSKEIKSLTEENKKLKEECNQLTEENKELKEKLEKSKEEKRNSQKPETVTESRGQNDEIKKLKDEIKNLNSQNEKLTEENEQEKQKLKDEIKNLNSQNEKLTEENEQEKQKSPTEENKISELKPKIENLQKTLEQQKQESKDKLLKEEEKNSELTQRIKNLEKTLEQQEQESKDKLNKEEKKNSELTNKFAVLKKTLEQKEKESKDKLEEKDKENSKLTKTINDFQAENEQLKKPNKSNSPKSAASKDLKDAEAQVKQLKEKNEKLIEEKNKAVKEVDNLKNRLSQIAGSKLTDNNPGIADLSDPNRPLNLGEKFSELYDNQWTDAMEEMTCTVDEKQSIEILLRIVNDAYKFCVKISDGYCDQIENGITKLFKTELSSLQKKLTKDYRKSMAVYLVSDLEEEFCKTYKYDGKAVKSYQKQCIRVCWFMAVQDPKVFIDVEDVSGKKFEDDKYKHYTKTGKVTDYLVWPVLYLHKGGPMLGKGVAQGK